jgi:hypothetical protein
MKATLTRKYGPLPLWAWVTVSIVLLYLGLIFFRNRNASASNNLGTQQPKSNLGTVAGNGSGGSGGFTFPDTLPNTQVGESTQTPPFTAPAPVDSNSAPATSAPAVAPLQSAPITAFSSTVASPSPTPTITSDPPSTPGDFPTYIIPADPSTGTDQMFFTPQTYFQNEQGLTIEVPSKTQKILPQPLPAVHIGASPEKAF